MVHQEQITFDTTDHRQMDDLTDKVAAIVERSSIKTGIAQVMGEQLTYLPDTASYADRQGCRSRR